MKKIISFCLLFIFCGIINVNAATTYKVNYVLSGGTNNKKNIVEYSTLKENFVLLSPSRAGYTFDGWYIDKVLTNKVDTIPKGSTGNKTYYAKWIVNTYSIKFSGNGATSGSMARRNNLRYDKNYILAENTFKRTGYKFTGWNTRYDGNGKSYADKATVGQVSKVNGGVVTLYAQWKPVNYVIYYELDGGTNNSDNPSIYNIESVIELKNPTKKGWSFDGWYSDANFKNKVTNISNAYGIKRLYAKWSIIKYDIIYQLNGGVNNTTNAKTYDVESNITLKEATKAGYTFDGWYTDKALTKNIDVIEKGTTGNITIYAKWIANTYSIKYDGNGSTSGSMKTRVNLKYDKNYVLNANTFFKEGYKFIGWNTKSDGTGIFFEDKQIVGQLTKINNDEFTLYAQWSFAEDGKDGGWLWPTITPYSISSNYGYRWGKLHSGVDIYVGGRGSSIYSARAGVIYSISSNSSSGFYVIIKHDNGYYTRYAHMQNTNGNDNLSGVGSATKYIEVGQRVGAHQVIGEVGSSGNATGPHLHFEIWDGVPFQSQSYDPLTFY